MRKQPRQKIPAYKVNRRKGFTLVELMIVIGIIAILAAIGVPSYQAQIKKGRASTAKGDLLNLAANMEIYKQGNFTYTGAKAADLYSAGSPPDADVPHFILFIDVLDGGRNYRLAAQANAYSEASDDGIYWFNPVGKNCYFENASTSYNDNCAGGTEWQ